MKRPWRSALGLSAALLTLTILGTGCALTAGTRGPLTPDSRRSPTSTATAPAVIGEPSPRSSTPPAVAVVSTRTPNGCLTTLPLPAGLHFLGPPVRVPQHPNTLTVTWIPGSTDTRCQQEHTTGSRAQAQALAAAINSSPVVKPAAYFCLADSFSSALVTLDHARPVLLSLQGCGWIDQKFSSARHATHQDRQILLQLSPRAGAWRSKLHNLLR